MKELLERIGLIEQKPPYYTVEDSKYYSHINIELSTFLYREHYLGKPHILIDDYLIIIDNKPLECADNKTVFKVKEYNDGKYKNIRVVEKVKDCPILLRKRFDKYRDFVHFYCSFFRIQEVKEKLNEYQIKKISNIGFKSLDTKLLDYGSILKYEFTPLFLPLEFNSKEDEYYYRAGKPITKRFAKLYKKKRKRYY